MPELTPKEERVVATHEAGHAVVALFSPHSPPIDRITIRGDTAGALGYVRYQDRQHKFVITRNEMADTIAVLMGGREAEALLLDDLSIGSSEDLRRATIVARTLVEELGMGGDATGVVRYNHEEKSQRHPYLSEEQRSALDRKGFDALQGARATYTVGDFDGDRRPDLVVVDTFGIVRYFRQAKSEPVPTFEPPIELGKLPIRGVPCTADFCQSTGRSGPLASAILRSRRGSPEHFPEKACPALDAGWAPVFRRKCDQA